MVLVYPQVTRFFQYLSVLVKYLLIFTKYPSNLVRYSLTYFYRVSKICAE
ncbi:MAG: hypothetical protein ACI9FJ_002324 [Alteromonadaceae bacterium]|jgi:hypothetical protein